MMEIIKNDCAYYLASTYSFRVITTILPFFHNFESVLAPLTNYASLYVCVYGLVQQLFLRWWRKYPAYKQRKQEITTAFKLTVVLYSQIWKKWNFLLECSQPLLESTVRSKRFSFIFSSFLDFSVFIKKLFLSILLEAQVVCTQGTTKQLFKAECDSSGFKITIQEVSWLTIIYVHNLWTINQEPPKI